MNEAFHVFDDRESLSFAAAEFVGAQVRTTLARNDRVTLVLAGGSTPGRIYELLSNDAMIRWADVHLFIGDERFVDPHHPESNRRMLRETLVDRTNIPDRNLHFIDTTLSTAKDAAEAYQRDLITFFGGPPRFDLVLLGMGGDGHTASLFPNTPEAAPGRLAVATTAPPEYRTRERVSLTNEALEAAETVLFLIAGSDKAEPLRAILEGERATLPAGRVRPRGQLLWYVDREARGAL